MVSQNKLLPGDIVMRRVGVYMLFGSTMVSDYNISLYWYAVIVLTS